MVGKLEGKLEIMGQKMTAQTLSYYFLQDFGNEIESGHAVIV